MVFGSIQTNGSSSMYEQQFDAEWEDLTIDEATHRAYAIGVAASLGKDHTAELKRIYADFDSPYDQSLVELSFEEGRNRADKEIGDGNERTAVWDDLVVNEDMDGYEPDQARRGRQSIPESIQRASMLDTGNRGAPPVIDLPEFLRGP